ncbi:uncharacterized protein LOC134230618 [Saccostrea cucullata]|uniref:uncharacterized protein LOC134230618 n=1 Tax=Saccostrea cuccullata TaxID=36930 RepID=UPI002ED2F0D2
MDKVIGKLHLDLVLILSTLVTIVNPQVMPVQTLFYIPPFQVVGGTIDNKPEVGIKFQPKESDFSMHGTGNINGDWKANINLKKNNIDYTAYARNVGSGVEAGVGIKANIGGGSKKGKGGKRRSWLGRVFRG